MKLKVIRDEIYPFLNYAINFTSTKNINSIIQNVYLEAENDSLTLATSNIHTGFRAKINCLIEETGKTTVPCKKLLDIIKEFPSSAVIDMEFEGNNLKIKCDKSIFNLATIDPQLFPTMSEITPEYFLELRCEKLLSLFKKTYFCISNDPSKIEYTGCHFKTYGNKLELASADYQRVAYTIADFDEEFSDEFLINIPKKTVTELIKILEVDNIVRIETDKRQILFKINNIEVYSKLIEKYIRSITALFDSELPIYAKVPKDEFVNAIRRVQSIASENTHAIVLSFSGNKLSIYSIESDYGLGYDLVDDIEIIGGDIDIIFNARILLEVLNAMDSDFVELKMGGRKSPIIVKPYNEDWYKYLVVPLTIERY